MDVNETFLLKKNSSDIFFNLKKAPSEEMRLNTKEPHY